MLTGMCQHLLHYFFLLSSKEGLGGVEERCRLSFSEFQIVEVNLNVQGNPYLLDDTELR